jgi:hypothetical protein
MSPTHDIWTDLADRESDGIEVTLLWNSASGRVKVAVRDTKLGRGFELDVDGADALSAFHHPFAYAENQRVAKRVCVTTNDLQLQI